MEIRTEACHFSIALSIGPVFRVGGPVGIKEARIELSATLQHICPEKCKLTASGEDLPVFERVYLGFDCLLIFIEMTVVSGPQLWIAEDATGLDDLTQDLLAIAIPLIGIRVVAQQGFAVCRTDSATVGVSFDTQQGVVVFSGQTENLSILRPWRVKKWRPADLGRPPLLSTTLEAIFSLNLWQS